MKRFLLLMPVTCLLIGCAHKTDLTGNWRVDTSQILTGATMNNGLSKAQMDAMAKSMEAMLSYEFKKDTTFTGPGATAEGTYTVDGNTVEMNYTKLPGLGTTKPGVPRRPMIGNLSSDGKTIKLHDGNTGESETSPILLTLVRS